MKIVNLIGLLTRR